MAPQIDRHRDPVDRFIAKIDFTDSCWLWRASKDGKGYGQFSLAGRWFRAHRYAWLTFVGPIPPGLQIDHVLKAGCTNRHCVNPDHLEVVTPRENSRRSKVATKTHCIHGHELTAENTKIRSKSVTRTCRTCLRHWKALGRQRRKAARLEVTA